MPKTYKFTEFPVTALPVRSALVRLRPSGAGTALIVGLTSYINQLAEAHSVLPKTLVIHEILPLLNRDYLSTRRGGQSPSFWTQTAKYINGTSRWAKDWAAAVGQLTLQDNIPFLTFLPWVNLISGRELLRPTKAWCSKCFASWKRKKETVYEPLLWSLSIVKICLEHHTPLQTLCPACQHPQPILAPKSYIGYCAYCQAWLGSNQKGKVGAKKFSDSKEAARDMWIANAIGELLAAAPTMKNMPEPQAIGVAVTHCLDNLADGDINQLARDTGLSRQTLRDLLRGNQTPRLETLLRLAAYSGISPLNFLLGKFNNPRRSITWERPIHRKTNNLAKKKDRPGLFAVQKHLQRSWASPTTPPPSMKALAHELGYDQSYLIHKFPSLTRDISARYLAYQQSKRRERTKRLCKEVVSATRQLHRHGEYPSLHRVRKILSNPNAMREPVVLKVWHQEIRKLDSLNTTPKRGMERR